MTRVGVFAASRADLFPLSPVLAALNEQVDLEVTLFASGTMRNSNFGDPLSSIDGIGVDVHWVAGDLESSDVTSMAGGGARISSAMASALTAVRPEAMIVLGDRWELLYAVPPIVLHGLPLVHLHGGEVTEGAVDDRIRHAVTKLADLHCVSTEAAAVRLRQLGEPADRITVTGAPSLDRASAIEPASDETLSRILGREVRRPLALLTYHPVTAAGPDPGFAARVVLDAVAATCASVIVTHPGLDRGRDEVLQAIKDVGNQQPHLTDVEALGTEYLSVLAACDVVVGNSSSGILEAATFGVPVVNVGDRQRGRDRSVNVLDAPENEQAVASAVRSCLTEGFRERARSAVNIYGDGHASPRIVGVVRRAVEGGLQRKLFVDADRSMGRGA